MNLLYFYLFLLVHPYLGMWWKSFELAGRKSWEALIPGYNYFIAFKLGSNKPWWTLLLIFPGVHLVMWSVANTSYIRRFGYFSLIDTLQGVFFPYLLLAKIAKAGDKMLPETNWANSKEVGDREWGDHLALFLSLPVFGHVIALGIAAVTRAKPGKRTKVKEWGDSILFALVAASIIRTYVFEPFQIPTGSMEKTLLVGDFLFVNKLAYGPKVPVTPLSYPLVHNTVPWVNTKSYSSLETSEYTRMPGFTKVNRNDVVVFNYPSGDTAIYDPRMPNGLMGHDYHDYVLFEAKTLYEQSNNAQNNYRRAHQFYTDSLTRVNAELPDSVKYPMTRVNELTDNYVYKDFIQNLEFWKSRARTFIAEDKKSHQKGDLSIIEHYGIIPRPVDKRENYIKRCVGIPGDFLEIKESILYVNDSLAFVSENQNLMYQAWNELGFKAQDLEAVGLEMERRDYFRNQPEQVASTALGTVKTYYTMHLTKTELKKLQKIYPQATFDVVIMPQYSDIEGALPSYRELTDNLFKFPKDPYVNNTVSDFTRFQIPKKGQTIDISKENIAWFRRIITAYEGHKLEEKDDGIYIDGQKVKTYTFAMNYYWMMGDNRYNSADSRMWGFVPEDHIVGKASLVWFSKSAYKGVRWERLFSVIK